MLTSPKKTNSLAAGRWIAVTSRPIPIPSHRYSTTAAINRFDEGQLNYTHVFGPNVVNNFIGSILYYSFVFGSPDLAKALQTFPYYVGVLDSSLNTIGPQPNFPAGRNSTQWQLVDDVSWAAGHNNFKFGVNFRRLDVTNYDGARPFPAMYRSFGDLGCRTCGFRGAELCGQPTPASGLLQPGSLRPGLVGGQFQAEVNAHPACRSQFCRCVSERLHFPFKPA